MKAQRSAAHASRRQDLLGVRGQRNRPRSAVLEGSNGSVHQRPHPREGQRIYPVQVEDGSYGIEEQTLVYTTAGDAALAKHGHDSEDTAEISYDWADARVGSTLPPGSASGMRRLFVRAGRISQRSVRRLRTNGDIVRRKVRLPTYFSSSM
jgi:hypothetical protein